MSNKRNPILEIMENILIAYIEDYAKNSDPLYQFQIQAEAREIVKSIEMQYYENDETKLSGFDASTQRNIYREFK